MNRYLLVLIPLLFTPNIFSSSGQTIFGEFKIMDYVVVIIFMATSLTRRLEHRRKHEKQIYLFLLVSFFTIILMYMKYDYTSINPYVFSFLKLLKFLLYTVVGYRIADSVTKIKLETYIWLLYIIGFLLSLSVLLLDSIFEQEFKLYTGDNMRATALLGIVVFLLIGVLNGTQKKMRIRIFRNGLILLMIMALLYSKGRGAILSFVLTMLTYGIFNLNRSRIWGALGILPLFLLLLYNSGGQFTNDFNRSILTDESEKLVIDDGRRGNIFSKELPNIFSNPFLGTGFFHRGGKSPILAEGSHNQFLQILLETGVIGFVIYLRYFTLLIKEKIEINTLYSQSARIAILSVLFCCMSGEYIYASEAYMSLLLVALPYKFAS